jgi:outer membrane usher protein
MDIYLYIIYGDPDRGDIINFGATADFLIGRLGEINLSAAQSNEKDIYGISKKGYGYLLRYFYKYKALNANLSLKGYSKEYSNLLIKADNVKSRFEGDARISFNQKLLGSITASFSSIFKYTGQYIQKTSLSYRKQFFKNLALYITGSRTEDGEEITDEITVSLNINFSLQNNTNAHINYENYSKESSVDGSSEDSTVKASIQKNVPSETGYGYSLRAESEHDRDVSEDWETNGQSSFTYRLPFGMYFASYNRTAKDTETSSLRASGGIAYINSSLYFTNSIRNAFALVKVENIEGVTVKSNNQTAGITDSDGELLVSNLTSYNDNIISINPEDLPLSYNILYTKKYISLPYGGGGTLKFDVKKLQAFEGYAYFIKDGKKIPAEYAGLALEVPGNTIEFIVGEGGAFYIENVPPGTYPARLWDSNKECHFNIVFPDSDDIIVDIGEISCEIN